MPIKDMTLLDEIIECAEQDLNIDQIITYIVITNANLIPRLPNDQSKLIFLDVNDDIKTKLKSLISKLYISWIAKVKGTTSKTIDENKYDGFGMMQQTNSFYKERQFSENGIIKLPTELLTTLDKSITNACSKPIDPDTVIDKEHYLYVTVHTMVDGKRDLTETITDFNNDSKRGFHTNECLITQSPNFRAAVDKLKAPLVERLDQTCLKLNAKAEAGLGTNTEQIPSPTTPDSFISSLFARFISKSEDPSVTIPLLTPDQITPDETNTDTGKTTLVSHTKSNQPDLITALSEYKKQRKEVEKSNYHFWGALFSFTGTPFSLEEKENAVNKLIYWKLRQQDKMIGDDQLNQFTSRDIAAIHDHRLGVLCEKYKDELTKLFVFAESKKINDDCPEVTCGL